MPYTLPELPYAFDALQPHIDTKTMEVHHGKHHQAYLDKLNAALESHPELQEWAADELLLNLSDMPDDIAKIIRNNGGGHVNHTMFWKSMSPDGGGEPTGDLAEAISNSFSSFEKFKENFQEKGLTQFGSGWVWLVKDASGDLKIVSTSNQDNPLSEGMTPLLGNDVWEHAYYLNYQNKRADYLKAWWNVVDWNEVGARFAKN